MSNKRQLLLCRHPRDEASLRLVCFPWAGGGANFYTAWGAQLPPHIEVHGVSLPGREARQRERPMSSAKEVIALLASTIATSIADKPFILFGHSMGALLAYETAVVLRKVYRKRPEHLYLSGVSAPHSKSRLENLVDLEGVTDEEFQYKLKDFGGTPPELLQQPELMKVFVPPLKADFHVCNQIIYDRPEGPPPLNTPFTFFDGADDGDHDYDSWKELTSGSFKQYKLPGGHFYLREPPNTQRIVHTIFCDYPTPYAM